MEVSSMISQRTTHYWLWFILLGVVTGLAYLTGKASLGGVPQSEPIWLFATGLLGIVVGSRALAARISRPFDLVVGLLFTLIGLLGVLHNFGISFTGSSAISNVGDSSAIIGLSLSLPFVLLHTLLGLTSLNQGLKSTPVAPPVVVNPATTEVRQHMLH
jgi:hypothetical protein